VATRAPPRGVFTNKPSERERSERKRAGAERASGSGIGASGSGRERSKRERAGAGGSGASESGWERSERERAGAEQAGVGGSGASEDERERSPPPPRGGGGGLWPLRGGWRSALVYMVWRPRPSPWGRGLCGPFRIIGAPRWARRAALAPAMAHLEGTPWTWVNLGRTPRPRAHTSTPGHTPRPQCANSGRPPPNVPGGAREQT